jgi:hypothetical protein
LSLAEICCDAMEAALVNSRAEMNEILKKEAAGSL